MVTALPANRIIEAGWGVVLRGGKVAQSSAANLIHLNERFRNTR